MSYGAANVEEIDGTRLSGKRLVLVRLGPKQFEVRAGPGADSPAVARCTSRKTLVEWALDRGAEVATLPKPDWHHRVDDLD